MKTLPMRCPPDPQWATTLNHYACVVYIVAFCLVVVNLRYILLELRKDLQLLLLLSLRRCASKLPSSVEYNGFCTDMTCNTLSKLRSLENCSVVVGDLKVLLMERTEPKHFDDISFPKLKEVTGFMVVYRVAGLESLGKLFPSLARIRGATLLYNYALIVYDVPNLTEIGLFNLLKIDRGGVIVWGGPLTCYVHTVDWAAVAPRARHVLSSPDKRAACSTLCSCSAEPAVNRCWNNKKCQRFLEGPDSERCSRQCLGCRKTNASSCSLCKEFTHGDHCVSQCPPGTSILSASNYCVTRTECQKLNQWEWSGRCVSACPENYVKYGNVNVTCKRCDDCKRTCGNLTLQALASIQEAEKCVYVNGSLTIHLSSIPHVASELRIYLKNIVQVSDYILIYGSITLTSLHFLSSLRLVRGSRLYMKRYSVAIYDMNNLQELFLPNVTEKLKVERGTLHLYGNPMLCIKQIEKLKPSFPELPSELDVPQGLNGYSGTCSEVPLGLKISATNETSAVATFYPGARGDSNYTILYVRVPHGSNATIVPETCSEFEWHAVSVNVTSDRFVRVPLVDLQPASAYVACIETFTESLRFLARSAVVNFLTPVGKPEPPFILELTASYSNAIMIKWVDHVDFKPFIARYELDVKIVDILDVDVTHKNNCLVPDSNFLEIDYSLHAKVKRPPRKYERACESMCGVLSTATVGAMVEEHFDVCSGIEGCATYDYVNRPKNSTAGGIVKSMSLNLNGSTNYYEVSGLAPFRDYRFELRSCTREACSRTVRELVRTLRTKDADTATLTHASADTAGHITVKWDPPTITNGPVLCYNVEIYPGVKINDASRTLPHVSCVASNITDVVVKSIEAKKYFVKLCSTTLGSSYMCTEFKEVDVEEEIKTTTHTAWLSGALVGVVIYFASVLLGWRRRRVAASDDIPLVDATSQYRTESVPPAVVLSDLAPLYDTPHRVTHWE